MQAMCPHRIPWHSGPVLPCLGNRPTGHEGHWMETVPNHKVFDTERCDLVLRGATLLDGRVRDIAITEGKIVELAHHVALAPARTLHLDGKVVLPGFVEAHTHLDKAL